MELTSIPDLGATYAQMLRDAGVGSVAALAGVTDLDALAATTRIHAATLETFRAAAREMMERALGEAGVASPEDLVNADIEALVTRSGIERQHLARYQQAARERLGLAPALPDRVVLRDGSAKAVVHHAGAAHEGVALVTVRIAEDEADALGRAGESAVVLKEKSPTAPVRLAGRDVGPLPIYKQREDGSEFRVRVASVKERPLAAGSSGDAKPAGGRMFGRFLGKKKP